MCLTRKDLHPVIHCAIFLQLCFKSMYLQRDDKGASMCYMHVNYTFLRASILSYLFQWNNGIIFTKDEQHRKLQPIPVLSFTDNPCSATQVFTMKNQELFLKQTFQHTNNVRQCAKFTVVMNNRPYEETPARISG